MAFQTSKIQDPTSGEDPRSKSQAAVVADLGSCSLDLLWTLDFGSWMFRNSYGSCDRRRNGNRFAGGEVPRHFGDPKTNLSNITVGVMLEQVHGYPLVECLLSDR